MRKKVEQSQYYFENSGKKSLISVEKGQLLVEKQVEEEVVDETTAWKGKPSSFFIL